MFDFFGSAVVFGIFVSVIILVLHEKVFKNGYSAGYEERDREERLGKTHVMIGEALNKYRKKSRPPKRIVLSRDTYQLAVAELADLNKVNQTNYSLTCWGIPIVEGDGEMRVSFE